MNKSQAIKDAFLDMLNQACGVWERDPILLRTTFKGYDSLTLSAYDDAIDLAVELGWIKPEEKLR